MSWLNVWRRQRALVECAPFSDTRMQERPMRIALFRARKGKQTAQKFSQQQAFDRAIAALVRAVPVPKAAAEWFVNEKLVAAKRRRDWKKTARNPAAVAAGLAIAVILVIGTNMFLERLHEFPGSARARKLLTVASSTRIAQLEPIRTNAGELADLFFMKHRLEHYDVPPEFARFRTGGYRVFDDEEGHQVAQIAVDEKRMQFFLFPAEKRKDGRDSEFKGWRYLDHEGWVGAVQLRHGVCFMAALRGRKKDLATYLPKGTK
jgi:hypothetical protein